jgi:hypothetical protein
MIFEIRIMKRLFFIIFRLLSSYGLACALLLLLCLLTYLGTIEQASVGLYEAQRRYFESWLAVYPLRLGGGAALPIPLPGAMTLMTLFGVNLLLGGVARLRRGWNGIGLFVVHGGVLFLLVGGLVTHYASQNGLMTLVEGASSSRFESDREWELAIVDPSPAGADVEYVVPWKSLLAQADGRELDCRGEGLPFDLIVGRYDANAQVLPKGPMADASTPAADGVFVQPLAPSRDSGDDLPAIHVTLADKQADKQFGARQQAILWGGSAEPFRATFAGRAFELSLRRRAWTLPFAIRLDKFTREFHPGTRQPKRFESAVTKIENSSAQNVVIRMNEPFRTEGYALFQSGYAEDPGTGRLSSTLAVARNPADRFPLYACVVITAGMLLHFGASLFRALKREKGDAK